MRDRDTILAFMEDTGVTANRLSNEAGIPATCIYRILTDSSAGLSVKTLDKVTEAMSRYSKRTRCFRQRKETQTNPE